MNTGKTINIKRVFLIIIICLISFYAISSFSNLQDSNNNTEPPIVKQGLPKERYGIISFGFPTDVYYFDNNFENLERTTIDNWAINAGDHYTYSKYIMNKHGNIWYRVENSLEGKISIYRIVLYNTDKIAYEKFFEGNFLSPFKARDLKYSQNSCFYDAYADIFGVEKSDRKTEEREVFTSNTFYLHLPKKEKWNHRVYNWGREQMGLQKITKKTLADDIRKEAGLFFSNNKVLLQGYVNSEKPIEYKDMSLVNNHLILVDKDKMTIKDFTEGFYPKVGPSFDEYDTPIPMTSSPDGEKAAVLIRYKTPDSKWAKQDPTPIWLSVFDVNSEKTTRIVPLNIIARGSNFMRLLPMKWFRYMNKDYICLSIPGSHPEIFGKMQPHSLLIDVERKEIIKQWQWSSESMKPSPDGRFLAMFIRFRYPVEGDTDNIYEENGIWIYDMEKDSLKHLSPDNSYSDIFWIK